jgi:glycosyltransferase involved in cell wall biosynthesis
MWQDLLEKNMCVFCVDPADQKAIAKAISFFKTHPEEAKALGENGKRLVQETYNWKAEEKKLFEFYQALMS